MSKFNKKIYFHIIIASFAILALIFLFVMTATEGKYLRSNKMDDYIIKITDGEKQSYLDSKTPTAMVINKLSGSNPFLKRDCRARGTCAEEEMDRNAESAQTYTTQDDAY